MQISLPFEPAKISSKKNSYRDHPRQLHHPLRCLWYSFVVFFLFAGFSALCVAGYHGLLSSPLLQVTRIQVSGCERLDPHTVIQQAQIPSGVNILSLDLDKIRHRLSSHPWIASAVISREIPDRIRIEITERKPMALVKGRHFYLIDQQGLCFTSAIPSEHAGLPIITGLKPETLEQGFTLPRELTVLVEELYRESTVGLPWRLISEIRWHNRNGGLSIFVVQGGIQIDLGTGNYGPKIMKLERVLRYLEEKEMHHQLKGIDLSYGNRVFVRGNFKLRQHERPQQKGV